MSNKQKPETIVQPTGRRVTNTVFYAGLAGTGLLGLSSLMSQTSTNFDTPLNVAAVCFAVAVPFLAYVSLEESTAVRGAPNWKIGIFGGLGNLALIIGFTSMFMHLSQVAGWVFLGCVCLVVVTGLIIFKEDQLPGVS